MTTAFSTAYCTNVHAGTDLDAVQANLKKHATRVRSELGNHGELGVGLWLAANATNVSDGELDRFQKFLQNNELAANTFNAFPYTNFHQAVVKHDVYRPDWATDQRLNYTKRICEIADRLTPPEQVASVSTLPLGWPSARTETVKLDSSKHFLELVDALSRIEDKSGRRVVVCLEPEPGCILSTSVDVVDYFEKYLFGQTRGLELQRVQRYLGVCHDICHAAVMFEEQRDVLFRYHSANILVGKVQVSSAIKAELGTENIEDILVDLEQFAEPRYLHQSSIRRFATRSTVESKEQLPEEFYEDLPLAIAALKQCVSDSQACQIRSHFHVPIHLESIRNLLTTRDDIKKCLELLCCDEKLKSNFLGHFEVETYAWNVSPAEVRARSLNVSIAKEMRWLDDQLTSNLKERNRNSS